ncbi:MAG: hypothetical protein J6U14_09500 [Bacteroidaceae bacterium]|nr:hypothetical protein [Bacteroidaceae bacterium]
MSEKKKCVKSFKSNTRVFDDNSIEVTPQAEGAPSQKYVKKVGRSKRYETTGKNPLTCVELKCPEEVADKAAFFQQELAKLTKDIQIQEPQLPEREFLLNKEHVKVSFEAQLGRISAWFTIEARGMIETRRELYTLTSEIDKCFAFNSALLSQQKQ